MLFRTTTLTGLLVFFIPCAFALAQESDPFGAGGAGGDDPFGGPAPATEKAAADPFGNTETPAETATAPFGTPTTKQKPSQDPFGGGAAPAKAAKNPFGNPPQPAAKKSAASMSDPFGAPARKAANPGPAPKPSLGSSKVDEQIRETLSDEMSQTFVETPLQEAVATLSRTHNIPIVVDERALEEIGLAPDVPVNLDLRNITLRSFLRLMLRELDCTYVVKDEVLQITTVESAEQNLVVKSYTMNEELSTRAEKIIKALTSSVNPDAWSQAGGPCAVNAVDHVLVVAGTETVHEEVAKFMEMLTDAFEKKKAK